MSPGRANGGGDGDELELPVVAAVNGTAAGASVPLALAARGDRRLSGEAEAALPGR